MTKLEELRVQAQSDPDYQNKDGSISTSGLKCLMKEYAELYARKCLIVAMNNATILHNSQPTRDRIYYIEAYSSSPKERVFQVNPDSILNIKLPEHEN